MADALPVLPEAIDLERTNFEEQARDRADKMRRATLYFIGFAVVGGLIYVAMSVHQGSAPPPSVIAIVSICGVLIPIIPGVTWYLAARQRRHYVSKSESTYEFRCDDSQHEWRIEGIGPASGWRDISIECKALPRQFIASPRLHVRIDNERGVLKSGHLQDGGDDTSLFVIDKKGLPIGITIGHIEPKHASQEEPWVVKLTLFGDADALETLLAWPAAWHRDGPDIDFEQAEANRQA